ncbi:Zn(2)-C6 fungal-type DNA-binding domain protein, partial [Metarhizium hybridum]
MRAVPIIRSRTGCFTCRRRKKKCNEEKPVCSGCKRNKLECTWPAELPAREQAQGQPRGRERAASTTSKPAASAATAATPVPRSPRPDDVQSPVSPALQRLQLTASPRHGSIGSEGVLPNDAESSVARRYSDGSSDGSSSRAGGDSIRNGDEMPDDLDEAVSPASPLSSFGSLVALDVDAALQQRRMSDVSALSPFAFVSGRESFSGDGLYLHDNIPMNMSLLPSHGHDSFELLSYYLERTANSMGNGSTDINPFVAKLIPLAFSDPLVLHLILAQSAVHRQSSKQCVSGGEVATRYYADSLRMFRNLVGEYVSGKEGTNLVVTVGSLILCLTEVRVRYPRVITRADMKPAGCPRRCARHDIRPSGGVEITPHKPPQPTSTRSQRRPARLPRRVLHAHGGVQHDLQRRARRLATRAEPGHRKRGQAAPGQELHGPALRELAGDADADTAGVPARAEHAADGGCLRDARRHHHVWPAAVADPGLRAVAAGQHQQPAGRARVQAGRAAVPLEHLWHAAAGAGAADHARGLDERRCARGRRAAGPAAGLGEGQYQSVLAADRRGMLHDERGRAAGVEGAAGDDD